jgi:hypothetical protein
MMWQLIVKTDRDEYVIFVGGNEAVAREALAEVEAHIGAQGVVRIADRLTLRAEDITAAQIVDRYIGSPSRRRRVKD